MELTSVNNSTGTYTAGTTGAANAAANAAANTAAQTNTNQDTAAVYEKTENQKKDSANTIYNKDAIIKKLKMDQQNRITSMQNLVEKVLNKQKGAFDLANGSNLANIFRQVAQAATPDAIAQAQKDIAEDGYWGVEQTSDRLVSMAIALTGGDTSKADEMKDAITKGFNKAAGAWGEKLPQICQDTYDAAMKKMDDWKNGVTTAKDYSDYLS